MVLHSKLGAQWAELQPPYLLPGPPECALRPRAAQACPLPGSQPWGPQPWGTGVFTPETEAKWVLTPNSSAGRPHPNSQPPPPAYLATTQKHLLISWAVGMQPKSTVHLPEIHGGH